MLDVALPLEVNEVVEMGSDEKAGRGVFKLQVA